MCFECWYLLLVGCRQEERKKEDGEMELYRYLENFKNHLNPLSISLPLLQKLNHKCTKMFSNSAPNLKAIYYYSNFRSIAKRRRKRKIIRRKQDELWRHISLGRFSSNLELDVPHSEGMCTTISVGVGDHLFVSGTVISWFRYNSV